MKNLACCEISNNNEYILYVKIFYENCVKNNYKYEFNALENI